MFIASPPGLAFKILRFVRMCVRMTNFVQMRKKAERVASRESEKAESTVSLE